MVYPATGHAKRNNKEQNMTEYKTRMGNINNYINLK